MRSQHPVSVQLLTLAPFLAIHKLTMLVGPPHMDSQEQTRMPDRSGDFVTPHLPTPNLRLFLNSAIIDTISHSNRSQHPFCSFKPGASYNTALMANLHWAIPSCQSESLSHALGCCLVWTSTDTFIIYAIPKRYPNFSVQSTYQRII